jgi:hypothetical protein
VRSGQRVGKYVLGDRIASGGMAEVWAARAEGPGGFVKSLAMKFILESFAGDAELERLFVNEARVAAQLQHANLVSVFDFDKISDPLSPDRGRYYIAMERVDGRDLRQVLQIAAQRGLGVPAGFALHVVGEVLKGLRYVHDRRGDTGSSSLGLVHRDVSPHNILVGMGGEVKLSDFGIAKAMAQSQTSQSGMIRGKLAYASPEQLRGQPIDHRADQFALGVTLWEMLAGRRLFDGSDEMEHVGKVLRGQIPSLPGSAAAGADVQRIVDRMLQARAADRFPSTAQALAAVLAANAYVPDATVVADLMTMLFAARAAIVPQTVPVKLSDPPAAIQPFVVTEDAVGDSRAGAPASAPEVRAARVSLPTTVSAELGARNDHVPAGAPRRLSPVAAREAVTGSAYVSGAVRGGVPRSRSVVLFAAAVFVAVVAGIAIVVSRVDRLVAPATSLSSASMMSGTRRTSASPPALATPTKTREPAPVAVPASPAPTTESPLPVVGVLPDGITVPPRLPAPTPSRQDDARASVHRPEVPMGNATAENNTDQGGRSAAAAPAKKAADPNDPNDPDVVPNDAPILE